MALDLASADVLRLLPSCVVDTNERLRQRALRLITAGISQKVLAAKMGMAPSTFSKWLNQKQGIGPASVTALDGLNAYCQEIADAAFERAGIEPVWRARVSGSHTSDDAPLESSGERDGRAFATSLPAGEQTPPVPPASDPRDGSLRARLEREAREIEQDHAINAAIKAREARQPTPAPRRKTAVARARDRKRRR